MFRHVVVNGRTIVISVAEMVVTGPNTAYYRPAHVLSQPLLDETLKRTEDAIRKPGVIPPEQLNSLCRVVLRSLDHPSPEDPQEHSTGALINDKDEEFGKVHVTQDPSLQGPARLSNGGRNTGNAGQGKK